jgi:hypothetical protein
MKFPMIGQEKGSWTGLTVCISRSIAYDSYIKQ